MVTRGLHLRILDSVRSRYFQGIVIDCSCIVAVKLWIDEHSESKFGWIIETC